MYEVSSVFQGAGWFVQEIIPGAAAILPKPTVLVVEDEGLIRWALSEGLSDAGYVVRGAATGAEARAAVATCEGPLLVVLDLRLPDVADLSLLRHIRESRSDAPVVIMTAHGSAHDATEAKRLGASAFVGKPFDVTAMIDLVAMAWATRQAQ